ncbi:MAG: NADH-quinone oxidoreductase subunit J [Proteobacteria bacterium]|nr:NADH-quinone oxidoreductase subunit J [Pseudomonadota bacterium]
MILTLILLTLLVLAAVWTVMTRSLMMSAVGLALTSVILSIIIFTLNSPLAGVFELSVCAGLITVVFISTMSLTKPITRTEFKKQTKDRIKRYWYMPVIIILIGLGCALMLTAPDLKPLTPAIENDVRNVMWKVRQTDVLGQIIILLAGVFGVVVLFKERKKND